MTGRIDWNLPAEVITRHTRAMFPWPGATTTAAGALLKVLETAPVDFPPGAAGVPGTLLDDGTDPLVYARNGPAVRLLRVQPWPEVDEGSGVAPRSPSLRGTVLGDAP